MKSDLIKDFNLPKYIKGKSFAEASKAINKKFEGREGTEAEKTKDELLARLAKAQEYTKMQESMKANASQVPDMMNGQIPEGVDPAHLQQSQQGQMALGGAMGSVGTALELGQTAFGNSGIDTTGLGGPQEAGNGVAKIGGSTAKGAMTGFQAGGIWGALGGAALGAGAGIAGHNNERKDAAEGNRNFGSIQNNKFSNDFAHGGKIDPTDKDKEKELNDKEVSEVNQASGINFNSKGANALFGRTSTTPNPAPDPINFGKYKDVGYFKMSNPDGDKAMIANTEKNPHNAHTIKNVMRELKDLNPNRDFGLDFNSYEGGGPLGRQPIQTVNELTPQGKIGGDAGLMKRAMGTPDFGPQTGVGKAIDTVGKGLGKVADWGKENYGQILRAAPIATNAAQLANLDKADPVSLDRLDARYKPNRVDERALENRVQNEATNTTRGLANATNGSVGALRSNLLGSQLNKTNALSQANAQATQMNDAENTRAQQFNARQDGINLRQGTVEQQMNDQNEGAYNSAKSALTSQIGTDIGNFGKEKVNMKQVAEMFGYTWDGEYMRDKNGKKIDLSKVNK